MSRWRLAICVTIALGVGIAFATTTGPMPSGDHVAQAQPARTALVGPPIPPATKPAFQNAERRYSAFNAVEAAQADADALSALHDTVKLHPPNVRYLSLHNYPLAARPFVKARIDFVLNSMSHKRRIARTATVGPDMLVVRVNFYDYGIDPAAWESLANNGSGPVPLPEPYFHEFQNKTTSVVKTGTRPVVDANGRQVWDPVKRAYKTETFETVVSEKTELVRTHATWCALEEDPDARGSTLSSLIYLCNSENPILRADWFITNASIAPAYYRFIGLDPEKGTEADVLKNARADPTRDADNLVAALTHTKNVALHARILHRFPTTNGYLSGYIWISNDTRTGIGKANYMRFLDTFAKPLVDAKEIIWSNLAGLQQYAVVNAEGKLINFADEDIAIHGDLMPTRFQSKTVFVGLRSCAICHEGILPLDCKVRALASGNIANLATNILNRKDPANPRLHTLTKVQKRELGEKIEEAFGVPVDTFVNHDSTLYRAAVMAVNDQSPSENSAGFEQLAYAYVEQPITLEVAAADAGVAPEQLEKMLKEGINLDYTLTALLQTPPVHVSRQEWEERGFAALMTYLISYQPRQ